MSGRARAPFPGANPDELELLLSWLGYLRDAVLSKLDGLDDDAARWRPDGKLISLVGIVNHLTRVEWRWIDGHMLGAQVTRSEAELHPDRLSLDAAVAAYRHRAAVTDAAVRAMGSTLEPGAAGDGRDLRWVLLHLVNETARHAGHADATRELLDGVTGQ